MTTTAQWASNTTITDIAAWLRDQRAVVVLTHAKPDGDALGSTLALARALNRLSGTSGASSVAECWYAGPMPRWASSVTGETKVRVIEQGQPVPGALDPSAVVITDTGAWTQLDAYADWVRPRRERACVIDHHLNGDADTADRRLIETSAAAVCQPIARLCVELLGLSSAAELPEDIAEPLYLGLATDTGWFRHSNVTPEVFALAGELLAAGINHGRLHETIEMRERAARLRLMARALATLEIHEDKDAATMCLTKRDFDECGAAPGESGGFVDIPRSVESVRVCAVLTEQDTPEGVLTKFSLRSKSEPWNGKDPVDVAQVARTIGGGGHARAAGARILAPLDEAKRRLLEALP